MKRHKKLLKRFRRLTVVCLIQKNVKLTTCLEMLMNTSMPSRGRVKIPSKISTQTTYLRKCSRKCSMEGTCHLNSHKPFLVEEECSVDQEYVSISVQWDQVVQLPFSSLAGGQGEWAQEVTCKIATDNNIKKKNVNPLPCLSS